MGIMVGTGLASVIASAFVAIASAATLPVWSFLSSLIITLLIPSAGGHWAVQGPFVLPAAAQPARFGPTHGHGCRDGGKRREHAATFLGRPSCRDGWHPNPAGHGIHSDHLRCNTDDLHWGVMARAVRCMAGRKKRPSGSPY